MTNPGARKGRFSLLGTILLILILVGALAATAISLFEPYTLERQSMWLGPSTWVYLRNPYLIPLLIVQSALAILWIFLSKKKPFLHWLLIIFAIGGTGLCIFLLDSPPIFRG